MHQVSNDFEGLSILGGAAIVSYIASSAIRMRKGGARQLTYSQASSTPFRDRDFPARDHIPCRAANEQAPARDSEMKKEIPIER
jgi:hypothetical protein